MRRFILATAALGLLAGPVLAQTTVVTTTEPKSEGEQAAGTLAGAGTGAVAGALVGGPVGAAIGGVAGMAIGGAASAPDEVRQYVVANPTQPVVVEGKITQGSVIPGTVTLVPVPSNPEYEYFYTSDNQPVIVSKADRKVIYYAN
ncbi:DUF1236 domain-containing protein [uncultured Aureimonas sp.]|uniref:DUF1236 domain-containing protein n=1 Tax=uncultured Aureimonas sp. TaxID=1604662 RepID=UPI0025CEB5D9|nr:DUF1236 domain-containing protein [uncultured Aureimonas sp.]